MLGSRVVFEVARILRAATNAKSITSTLGPQAQSACGTTLGRGLAPPGALHTSARGTGEAAVLIPSSQMWTSRSLHSATSLQPWLNLARPATPPTPSAGPCSLPQLSDLLRGFSAHKGPQPKYRGGKLKVSTAFKERFKLMGSGAVKLRPPGFRHRRSRKASGQRKRLRAPKEMHSTYANKMRRMGFKGNVKRSKQTGMTVEVRGPSPMNFGGAELEELALAGDDTAWSLDGWVWDGKTFIASPVAAAPRAGKRHCSGLLASETAAGDANAKEVTEMQGLCCGIDLPCQDSRGASSGDCESMKERSEAGQDSVEGSKTAICQVEGCGRDVSGLSSYYQRCRICEIHIKEPQFLRLGKIQRFCQQCGRCHELSAFQGAKRSCKEQLAKHNARRRRRADKKGQELAVPSDAQAGSSPCQARLTDAFASLGAFDPTRWNGLGPQAAPATVGFPVSETAYVPVSFPAASLGDAASATDFRLPLPQAVEKVEDSSGSPGSILAAPALSSGLGASVAVGFPIQDANTSLVGKGGSFEAAQAMLGSTAQPQEYRSENLVVRLSVKLFNCTPAQLPTDVKQQLTGWLKSTPAGAEGYLRPGCVHLILQVHIAAEHADQISAGGLQQMTEHLARQSHPVWRNRVTLFDLNGHLGLARGGRLESTWHLGAGSGGALPQLVAAGLQVVRAGVPAEVKLRGRGLGSPDCKVLGRAHGQYFEVAIEPSGPGGASGEQASERTVAFHVEHPGLAWLEVHKGCMLSTPVPVLVCPTEALCTELGGWAAEQPGSPEGLLTDVGLLLQHPDDDNQAVLSATVVRVAEFAATNDLPELLRMLVESYGSAACFQTPAVGKTSLLHVCAKHESHRALDVLLALTDLKVDHGGPHGVTPLHLAALRGNAPMSARMLIGRLEAWRQCLACDGLSPSDFARRAGFLELDEELSRLCPAVLSQTAPALTACETAPAEQLAVEVQSMASDEEQPDTDDVEEDIEMGRFEGLHEEAALLGAAATVTSCVTWPGPLASVGPQGSIGKWSNITLLGTVACVCTCVMLLRAWV